MRVLIAFGSRYGSTEEIAHRLAGFLGEEGVEAVGKVDEISPFVIDPPYVLEWPFPKKEWADEMMGAHPEAERVDEHTLRFRNESFWDLPII